MAKRHGIRVRVPVVPCVLYYFSRAWSNGRVQNYVFWDPVLRSVAKTKVLFIPSEMLIQYPKTLFNQGHVYHAFHEATINPLLLVDPALVSSTTVVSDVYGQKSRVIQFKDGRICKTYLPAHNVIWAGSDGWTYSASLGETSSRSTWKLKTMQTFVELLVDAQWGEPRKSLQALVCPVKTRTTWRTNCDLGNGKRWDGLKPPGTERSTVWSDTSVSGQLLGSFLPSDFVGNISTIVDQLPPFPMIRHHLPQDLTDRIYSKLTLPDVNNLENIVNIKQMKKILPQLKKILKKRDIKSFAELYLLWKYTYSTTSMDLKAYYAFFKSIGKHSGRLNQMIRISEASILDTAVFTRYTISLPTYTASIMETLGLSPTLENIWDTLPFTFIADWFVGFGDVLERIHQENVLLTLKIRYCTTSSTLSDQFELLDGPFAGESVERTVYNRTTDIRIPTPSVELVFKNPLRHSLDGTALIVASRR